jgi:GxxExxY protein
MNEELNKLTEGIIGAAIAVHRELGPGLLESAYESCLEFELIDRGYRVERQKELPVVYRSIKIDCGYRIDLLVEDMVVIELKAVDALAPIHDAQLISYLKLSGKKVGLLINFNVTQLTKGIRRKVNGLEDNT